MRWLLFALWVWCGGALAATIPLQVSGAVARTAASSTGFVTTASATTWAGAAFNSGLTAQLPGKLVTVPATWRMASNAGQMAIAGLRINPAGLAASAALSWLLDYGIKKCADGTWCTTETLEEAPNGKPYLSTLNYAYGETYPRVTTPEDACLQFSPGTGYTFVRFMGTTPGYQQTCEWKAPNNSLTYRGPIQTYTSCKAGATLTNGQCIPPGYVAPGPGHPAGDTDWAKVNASTITDAVLNNLARDGAFLDLSPQVNTGRQTVPLSEPYIDPVTGKRYQDVAYVTPSTDGKTADLQVAKQEVDAQGAPVTDPGTGQPIAPEKTDDPCLAHPERIGCMEKGEIPAAPDLEGSEKTISITPDSGWGADTAACPADLTSTLRNGGVAVAFSFKPVCDGADMFRPVIIGMAWIAAVLIALGVGRKGD